MTAYWVNIETRLIVNTGVWVCIWYNMYCMGNPVVRMSHVAWDTCIR